VAVQGGHDDHGEEGEHGGLEGDAPSGGGHWGDLPGNQDLAEEGQTFGHQKLKAWTLVDQQTQEGE
jgi:hypothetical protein